MNTEARDSPMTDQITLTHTDAAQIASRVEVEVGKVIVGQRELIRAVMLCLLAEGHALVEGVPGLGKTELIKALGSACGLPFSRIQFTADLMPADIVGTQIIEESTTGSRSFAFRPGPVFASFVLADEVNRATPKTQAALLEAMAERTVTTGGTTRVLPRPFFVMATQNPVEMDGTYPLPEAQLDRFLLKAVVPYPSDADLRGILDRTTAGALPVAQAVTNPEELRALISLTRQVPIASHLLDHAVDLVRATQPQSDAASPLVRNSVRFGASPRGAQALVLAAKANALIEGRPNVSAQDVRFVAPYVLRHRLILNYAATAAGTADVDVVADVLGSVPIGAE
jgi:MoxR-like ATPase